MLVVLRVVKSLDIREDNQRALCMQSRSSKDGVLGDEVVPEDSISRAIEALWTDGGARSCFKHFREYQLPDSAV